MYSTRTAIVTMVYIQGYSDKGGRRESGRLAHVI